VRQPVSYGERVRDDDPSRPVEPNENATSGLASPPRPASIPSRWWSTGERYVVNGWPDQVK
jgi:hypothetical protein